MDADPPLAPPAKVLEGPPGSKNVPVLASTNTQIGRWPARELLRRTVTVSGWWHSDATKNCPTTGACRACTNFSGRFRFDSVLYWWSLCSIAHARHFQTY